MEANPEEAVVQHNSAAHRFEVAVGSWLAVADYEQSGAAWVMTHTFVPPELRGRGLAEKLVRAALQQARAEGRKVVPACSYVAGFIQRHAEFHDLLDRRPD